MVHHLAALLQQAKAKCYGKAENRVLKRVGWKIEIMNKKFLIIGCLILLLGGILWSCNKTQRYQENQSLSIESPTLDVLNKDLPIKISGDQDWIELERLSFKYIDKIIHSQINVAKSKNFSTPEFAKQLNLPLSELDNDFNKMRMLAKSIQVKYFQGYTNCADCSEYTEEKVMGFNNLINSARTSKDVYKKLQQQFRVKTISSPGTINSEYEEVADGPGCNNWRFYLCGAACLVSAPTGLLYAACIAMCVAQFC